MKKIIIILLSVLLLISFVSATFTRSNVQYSAFGEQSTTEFDEDSCESGQDILVQIAPFGCTPSVVRSDLLEDQDVYVYCQLNAIQLNPLMDVTSIESISFDGEFPEEVSGIGFYPAQAALGTTTDINSPILNNIGYAVIKLKQQGNESSMPDFVKGNLTAKIKYDVESAFGVGKAKVYLPELTDSEWNEKYFQSSFWDGRGYLRAESIDADSATIFVYDSDLKKTSSVNLQKGETSNKIVVPGFDYCQGSLQLKLEDLAVPDTRAKLKVNSDSFDVAQGEDFLDNKCNVVSLTKDGLMQKVVIKCNEDDETNKITLSLNPAINLTIDGEQTEKGVGSFLYRNGDKSVYLAYVGTKNDPNNVGDLFVLVLEKSEYNEDGLSESELNYYNIFGNQLADVDFEGGALSKAGDLLKIYGIGANLFGLWLAKGEEPFAIYSGQSRVVSEKQIALNGFAEPFDSSVVEGIESYENAVEDYDTIRDSFAGESYGNMETTFGEEALFEKILLAWDSEQKATALELCREFEDLYPDSIKIIESYCENDYGYSNQESAISYVTINGKNVKISFEGIYEPTFDDYGAKISVQSESGSEMYRLRKDKIIYINDEDTMQLTSLDEDSAKIKIVYDGTKVKTLTLEEDISQGVKDYTFTLSEINLKKTAKVGIIPNINDAETSADFGFNIGIEKRAFQFTPEATKNWIANLSKSISRWGNISNNLGTVIELDNTACLAVGVALNAINLIDNMGGKGIARQKVMQGEGGWYEYCANLVSEGKYISEEKCLLNNSEEIDEEVDSYLGVIKEQNDEYEKLQNKYSTKTSFGEELDTDAYKSALSNEVSDKLGDMTTSVSDPSGSGESLSVAEIQQILESEGGAQFYSIENLRDIDFYLRILEEDKNDGRAEERLYSLLSSVKENAGNYVETKNAANDWGVDIEDVIFFEEGQNVQKHEYTGETNADLDSPIAGIDGNTPVQFMRSSTGKMYVAVLTSAGANKLTISRGNVLQYYDVSSGQIVSDDGGGKNIPIYDETGVLQIYDSNGVLISEELIPTEIKNSYFVSYDSSIYKNEFKNPEVRYYETEPYKGFPAIVPFDLDNGWYAATKQALSSGNDLTAYDASGQVNSFYLCNVGENGKEEFFSGYGDDDCVGMNLGTGGVYDQFPGLSESEAEKLVDKAVEALESASKQYSDGVSSVVINGEKISVGEPAANIPDIQCQDFMSPKQCNLIFNVCDPVVCPSSRCDFGGAYPVENVVQTGIIGSIALCLPNLKEGIVVPVCLTGIKAGIDNFVSAQTAVKDCLEENLENGKNIGICDELSSVYICEFFWRNALPLADIAIPKLIGAALGQNSHGGGEYLTVQDAWNGAQSSISYFLDYFTANSNEAFGIQSTEEAGTAICRNFISAVVPSSVEVFDKMVEADSPVQYTGWFDEITLTTVTVPPTSQYKVFYHIYAGENSGAYYSVYLSGGSGSSYYQDTSNTRVVASGYINAGDYASATEDLTAPSGYIQLCINVNGDEECGFGEVSTSLAVDYVTDEIVADEATNSDITTEVECVSGTLTVFDVDASSELLGMEISDLGITRICSTSDPGKGSDPYAGTVDARWVQVGYCGDENFKCWLDTDSVADALDSPDLISYLTDGETSTLDESVLGEITGTYLDLLRSSGDYLSDEEFESEIKEISSTSDVGSRLNLIDKIFDKVYLNSEKAYLLLLRGSTYGEIAKLAVKEKLEEEKIAVTSDKEEDAEKEDEEKDSEETSGETPEEDSEEDENVETEEPEATGDDRQVIVKDNTFKDIINDVKNLFGGTDGKSSLSLFSIRRNNESLKDILGDIEDLFSSKNREIDIPKFDGSFGEVAWEIARFLEEIDYNEYRINADGKVDKSNVCSRFVTNVLIETAEGKEISIPGLELPETSGSLDAIDNLIELLEGNNNFIEINSGDLQKGDVVIFGEKCEKTQHAGIFDSYSNSKTLINIYDDPGKNDNVQLNSYAVNSDDWFFHRAFRYSPGSSDSAREKWTINNALLETNNIIVRETELKNGGKYKDNIVFVNELVSDGIIDKEICQDFRGINDGWLSGAENIAWLKEKLEENLK